MNRKYKVLHLVESLDAIGGMERVVAQIATLINKEEFDVEIWCVHRGGRFAQELGKQGLKLRVFNIADYYNPLNILKLTLELRRSHADIVHTHLYFASTIGRIAGKLAGVKVLINHVHSSYGHYSSRNLFIERLLSRITDKIICVSKNAKDFVITQEKIDPSRLEVIYNGISSLGTFSRQETRRAFNVKEEIVITSVANLLENKGHKVLLKALSLLSGRCKDFQCWIIGEGPLEKQLKELSRQLDLESKVIFWGFQKDVGRFLSASDIFVLASIQREGLSISILEAMSARLPVIASKVGGVPEVIDDQISGSLVSPDDPAALARAIEELILKSDKRREYAQEGVKKFKEQFEAKLMMERIENLYHRCLAPRTP